MEKILQFLSKKVLKFLLLSISLFVFVSVFSIRKINADPETETDYTTVADYTEVSSMTAVELPFYPETIVSSINFHSGSSSTFPNGYDPDFSMEKSTESSDHPYKATYVKGLSYLGKLLTVEIEVRLTEDELMDKTIGFAKIYKGDDGRVCVGWREGYDVHTNWKIRFIDPETGDDYPVDLLIGFKDPDESHYLLPTANMDIFYINSVDNAAGYYAVLDDGLYRLDRNKEIIDARTYKDHPGDFDKATFLVSVKSSTFEFDSVTIREGAIGIPYFYASLYNVTYVLNDDEVSPATNPETNPKVYRTQEDDIPINPATRAGYKFLGWKENDVPSDKIPAGSKGDKTFVASWEAINYQIEYKDNAPEGKTVTGSMPNQNVTVGDNTLNENQFSIPGYKFVGWNTEADESGDPYDDKDTFSLSTEDIADKKENDVVETLYAQWLPITYKVEFDSNGGIGTVAPMEGLEFDKEYPLNENNFSREGYDWLNWNTKPGNDGQSFDNKEIVSNLTEVDGSTVILYAQWNPWKYTIKYNANGGVGNMPDHVYNYSDETMMSDPNKFTRDGYKFTGFLYYDEVGNKILIPDIANLKKVLINKGRDSSVLLTAVWEKIPEPVTRYYYIPITGIK